MKTWLRKLRGVLGIGTAWGLVSSVLGLAVGAIVSLIWPEILPFAVVENAVYVALSFGIRGFVLGSGFASVLTMMEGRKTLDELSPGRAAVWGAVAGVGLAAALGLVTIGRGSNFTLAQIVVETCLCGTITAGLAAGTVSLARRAPADLGPGAQPQESLPLGDSDEGIPHVFGPVWAQHTLRSNRRLKRDERARNS